VCSLEGIGVSSIFKTIRSAGAWRKCCRPLLRLDVDRDSSICLGYAGRNNSNPSSGSSDPQTWSDVKETKLRGLSVRESEEDGRGEGGGVYVVCKG